MSSRDPTYLGKVASVSGASITVHLARSVASGLSVIKGRTYRVGQVGSFIRIPQGYQDLFGIVSKVGASEVIESTKRQGDDTGRWMEVQLVGETVANVFERGISQYPNIDDSVHMAIEEHLRHLYDVGGQGHITIGTLSSAESISAKIALDELVTRHSAVLGSTGSGKSTAMASLLRSITSPPAGDLSYPSARILMLDVHGEYSSPLSDMAQVFSVDPQTGEEPLFIPYWALDTDELLEFLTGNLNDKHKTVFTDKIFSLKQKSQEDQKFPNVDINSMTVDTPIPFSLNMLWYDLIDFEITTFEGPDRDQPARLNKGDPRTLTPPEYKPHAMGPVGPFTNQKAHGITRPLDLLRSRLLDRRFNFLLHPGPWDSDLDGKPKKDLDILLAGWLGGSKPITILDLSGVPSGVLGQLIGSILKIIYESLFWGRKEAESGIERPLLVMMEEAHRYLTDSGNSLASTMVQKIAKEGRKYGIGAMIISQRPSEINETILSQCGTFFALRLANPTDRERVQGILSEGLANLLDVLPILRTGEAIITGEAAKLPMRCRITLPIEEHRPRSQDPEVSEKWSLERHPEEGYDRVVASWRAGRSSATSPEDSSPQGKVNNSPTESEV